MALADRNGTLGMAFYLGETDIAVGETEKTILLPGGARSGYMAKAMPNWNTSVYEYAQGSASFTVRFATPAPAGGILRWGVWY